MGRCKDEVTSLLKQAWIEAERDGVTLFNVDFELARDVKGNYHLVDVDFTASLDCKEQHK